MGSKKAVAEDKKFLQPGFKLEVDVWYKMKELALKQRRDAGDLMREAVAEYLQRHGQK